MLGVETGLATIDLFLLWAAAGAGLLGICMRVYLGIKYSRLIDEVDKMTTTKNRDLKRCKVKYEKCFAMNQGVANVGAFVDRFLSKLSVGPFTYLALYQMGAQMILLAVILMALLICHRILAGESLLKLLPYYAGCFAGLYVFLTITVVVNVQEKRTVLKISLVDYLENHLTARLGSVAPNLAKIRGEVPGGEKAAASTNTQGMPTPIPVQKKATGLTTAATRKPMDGKASREGVVASTMPTQVLPKTLSSGQARSATENTKRYQELSQLLEEFFVS